MVKDPQVLLNHIRDSIEKIETFTQSISKKEFDEDRSVVFSAVVRELEIIGEAAAHLPEEYRAAHPDIPWNDIINTRHRLIHGYWLTDRELIWKVVREDLLVLKKQILTLLSDASLKEQ